MVKLVFLHIILLVPTSMDVKWGLTACVHMYIFRYIICKILLSMYILIFYQCITNKINNNHLLFYDYIIKTDFFRGGSCFTSITHLTDSWRSSLAGSSFGAVSQGLWFFSMGPSSASCLIFLTTEFQGLVLPTKVKAEANLFKTGF